MNYPKQTLKQLHKQIWAYNNCDSLISRQKLILDGFDEPLKSFSCVNIYFCEKFKREFDIDGFSYINIKTQKQSFYLYYYKSK